jgi:hypothetical protein
MTQANAQDCTNLAWAYAKVGDANCGEILQAVAARMVGGDTLDPLKASRSNFLKAKPHLGCDAFQAQELANVAWAFATAGRGMPTLLVKGISAEIVSRTNELNAQDVANVTWAFAKLGEGGDPLFEAVFDCVQRFR